jgi:hypothetical protein
MHIAFLTLSSETCLRRRVASNVVSVHVHVRAAVATTVRTAGNWSLSHKITALLGRRLLLRNCALLDCLQLRLTTYLPGCAQVDDSDLAPL